MSIHYACSDLNQLSDELGVLGKTLLVDELREKIGQVERYDKKWQEDLTLRV